MTAPTESPLIRPGFWSQPLEDRMREFAVIREEGAFHPVTFDNPLTLQTESFDATGGDRYEDVPVTIAEAIVTSQTGSA